MEPAEDTCSPTQFADEFGSMVIEHIRPKRHSGSPLQDPQDGQSAVRNRTTRLHWISQQAAGFVEDLFKRGIKQLEMEICVGFELLRKTKTAEAS